MERKEVGEMRKQITIVFIRMKEDAEDAEEEDVNDELRMCICEMLQ